MLFWTRAFLCIGAATAMAVSRLPATSVPSPTLAKPAAVLAAEACRARPDLCAAVVTGGLGLLAHPRELPPAKPRAPRRAARDDAPVALGRRSLT